MNHRLVLIVAAQDLGTHPGVYAWIDCYLQALMQELSRDPTAIVVTGGSPGPEVWAEALAETFGVRSVAYLPDGTRRERCKKAGRWTPDAQPSGGAAVVHRDRALFERAQRADDAGDQVEVHAFLVAGASIRSSSQARTRAAEAAGLHVRRHTWGEAPAAAAPATFIELRAAG